MDPIALARIDVADVGVDLDWIVAGRWLGIGVAADFERADTCKHAAQDREALQIVEAGVDLACVVRGDAKAVHLEARGAANPQVVRRDATNAAVGVDRGRCIQGRSRAQCARP